MPTVFLRVIIIILLVSPPIAFPVPPIVGLPHILHKPTKLPVLDTQLDLPFQIITIIHLVTVIFMILIIVIPVSLVT